MNAPQIISTDCTCAAVLERRTAPQGLSHGAGRQEAAQRILERHQEAC